MEPFSPNRRNHQCTVAGETTGEMPTVAYLETNRYSEMCGCRESLYGWEGCIDAPMILPAGSTLNLPPRMIGGHEWEGALVSRNVNRG